MLPPAVAGRRRAGAELRLGVGGRFGLRPPASPPSRPDRCGIPFSARRMLALARCVRSRAVLAPVPGSARLSCLHACPRVPAAACQAGGLVVYLLLVVTHRSKLGNVARGGCS